MPGVVRIAHLLHNVCRSAQDDARDFRVFLWGKGMRRRCCVLSVSRYLSSTLALALSLHALNLPAQSQSNTPSVVAYTHRTSGRRRLHLLQLLLELRHLLIQPHRRARVRLQMQIQLRHLLGPLGQLSLHLLHLL